MKPTFIIYESRYENLSAFIKYKKLKYFQEKLVNNKLTSILEWQIKAYYNAYSSNIYMGEIIWFYSFIKFLEENNYPIIHCNNKEMFIESYNKYKKDNYYIITDYNTTKEIIYLIDSNRLYVMSYWAIFQKPSVNLLEHNNDPKYIHLLGKTIKNENIKVENILTPFDYSSYTDDYYEKIGTKDIITIGGNKNTFLGINIDIICPKISINKYSNIGLIWGKNIENININIVNFLCKKGIKLYSTCNPNLNIDGVIDLNIISNKEWHQLLYDVKFVLGSGSPINGTTIIEALYYKCILLGPKEQFPRPTYNNNIYFIDDLANNDILNIIQDSNFKENTTVKELCCPKAFEKRFNTIFNS